MLSAVGFTAAGIAAGSLAAKMMSAAAIANGGGVAAGSVVALGQSAGQYRFSVFCPVAIKPLVAQPFIMPFLQMPVVILKKGCPYACGKVPTGTQKLNVIALDRFNKRKCQPGMLQHAFLSRGWATSFSRTMCDPQYSLWGLS